MGSPTTLNIRNLLWHGFITPQEHIPLDAYGSMVIVLTMTIASAWKQHLQGPLQIRNTSRRSYFFIHPLAASSEDVHRLPERFDVIYEHLVFGSNTTSTTRPPQSTSAIVKVVSAILSLVRYSPFVTAGTDRQWFEACRHLQPDHVESSFVFVMATLPLMEHSLRQMYVSLNECKEDRNSALIAGEYYLTLDVILEAYAPSEFFVPNSPRLITHDPARIPNRLCGELGPGLMVRASSDFDSSRL